ncbi:DUF1345 domain-containing protein [Mucilaginibacter sp.]|uniref:DUF1345 domain-containing protein n=1 Tax=Mucilaginibacter sp. TaxID=1882438 RepID=UPI003B00EB50
MSEKNNSLSEKTSTYLDAHHRQFIALGVALITYFFTRRFSLPVNIMLTWLGYAFSILTISWISILSLHPKDVAKLAKLEDSSVTFIFLFIVASAFASLFAVFVLLHSIKNLPPAETTKHVLLSIGSVGVSWWLTHTVFTLRYAHLFYSTKNGKEKYGAGLDFPSEPEPDYLDFVYFSFVIGMTFQVSDVEISSRKIRRLAWVHSILSFVFNTVIVALSINIISGLFSN